MTEVGTKIVEAQIHNLILCSSTTLNHQASHLHFFFMDDINYSFIETKIGRGIITPLSNLIKARINPIKSGRRALSLVLN